MGIKRKLAELVLAAAVLLPSCDSKVEKEYVTVDHFQTPVTRLEAISTDGRYAGLKWYQGTDNEVLLFDSNNESLQNLSNDPNLNDAPHIIRGNKCLTFASPMDESYERIKVYEIGTGLIFQSPKFERKLGTALSNNKFFIQFRHEQDVVYSYDFDTNIFDEVIPNSEESYIVGFSSNPQEAVIFVSGINESGETIYLIKSDVLNPVITDTDRYNHDFDGLSDNLKKAYFHDWSADLIKIVDTDTGLVQQISPPANFWINHINSISSNGLCAIVELQPFNGSEKRYHLDTASNIWKLIPTSLSPEGISADGKTSVFIDYEQPNETVSVFKSSTNEFYSVLGQNYFNPRFMGFDSKNRILLVAYNEDAWRYEYILHDPVSKSNTQLGDHDNYYLWWDWKMVSNNKEYFAISGSEKATDTDVILLEDLVSDSRQVIKQEGLNLDFIGFSPSSNGLFIIGRNSTCSNLFYYNIQNSTFAPITNNSNKDAYFTILGCSNDENVLFFEQEYNNGTKEIMRYEFSSSKMTKVSNGVSWNG